MDIVVGKGIVPFLHGPPVERVTFHLIDHVLSIVDPVLLDIALSQPSPGFSVDGRLRLVQSAHIGKRGSRLIEGSLMELRSSHEHPCFPQEGVVFATVEPFDVAFSLLSVLGPFGSPCNTVALDGFLTLLDGFVEVALTDFLTVLVAHRVEGNHLREIVTMTILLFQGSIDIGLRTIKIGVVFGVEGMPPTRLRRVLIVGAGGKKQEARSKKQEKGDMTIMRSPPQRAPNVFVKPHILIFHSLPLIFYCILTPQSLFHTPRNELFTQHDCLIFYLVRQFNTSEYQTADPVLHFFLAHGIENLAELLCLLV